MSVMLDSKYTARGIAVSSVLHSVLNTRLTEQQCVCTCAERSKWIHLIFKIHSLRTDSANVSVWLAFRYTAHSVYTYAPDCVHACRIVAYATQHLTGIVSAALTSIVHSTHVKICSRVDRRCNAATRRLRQVLNTAKRGIWSFYFSPTQLDLGINSLFGWAVARWRSGCYSVANRRWVIRSTTLGTHAADVRGVAFACTTPGHFIFLRLHAPGCSWRELLANILLTLLQWSPGCIFQSSY